MFLAESISDHCPCLEKLDDNVVVKAKPFKYCNMWAQIDEFYGYSPRCVAGNMNGVAMYRLRGKLKESLKALNTEKFSNVENKALITL